MLSLYLRTTGTQNVNVLFAQAPGSHRDVKRKQGSMQSVDTHGTKLNATHNCQYNPQTKLYRNRSNNF